MPNTKELQVIEGGRAALELEALRCIATDFQKFLDLSRNLTPAANGQLKLAETQKLEQSKETDPQ